MADNKIINGNCWVAIFDFLGFRNLINEFTRLNGPGNLDVFYMTDYTDLLGIAKEAVGSAIRVDSGVSETLDYSWFSDTFLFFAREDSASSWSSYISIDSVLQHFFIEALFQGFPFRGALSFGDFYGDSQKGAFFGPALIDAYDYVEKQDWLGVVLTPGAVARLRGTELDPDRSLDYAHYNVPVKTEQTKKNIVEIRPAKENLYAYRISKWPYVEEMIDRMQEEAKVQHPKDYETKHKFRYEEVKRFIQDTKLKTLPHENSSILSVAKQ